MSKGKKFYLWVLGCQMNKSDAEKIEAIMVDYGLEKTSVETEADLIIVVACSVRQTAIDRIYGKAKQWRKKRRLGKLKAVLTGCVLAIDQEKMLEFFDAVLSIKDVAKISEITGLKKKTVSVDDYLSWPASRQSSFSALVPIMNGCNNFCSYCAVPYARGSEVSRSVDSIIGECRNLINQGYKEITLLGQNVNSYHDGTYDFPKLLEKIDGIKGDFWLRFLTSHPKDLSDQLIAVMAGGKHITPYLHLALQSGDEKILKAMNRRYAPADFLKIIEKARAAMPDLMISTDVIVGFPSESRGQFLNTAKVMKLTKFDMAYISRYSPRPQTAAAKLTDNISATEKTKRYDELNGILKKTALANSKKQLGRSVKVLIDGYKRGLCYGKTDSSKIVSFAGEKSMIGKFAAIKVKKVQSFVMFGDLV